MIKVFLLKNIINKNLLANALNQILGVGFPIIIQFYIIRHLNIEDIGYWGIFNSSSTLVLLAINFFYIYILKLISENPDKTETYLINSVVLAYAMFIIPFAIYITFLLYNYSFLYQIIIICSIPIITTPLAMDYYYQANLKNDFIFYRRLFVKILFVILLFTLVKDSSDFIIYAGISSFTLCLEHFINFYKIRKKIIFKNININSIIEIFKESISYLPFNLTYNVLPHYSIIIGFYFLDLKTLAIFTILFKLINLASTFISSSVMVLFPYKIKSGKNSFNDFKYLKNTVLFSLFVIFVFAVFSKLIFYIFLSDYRMESLKYDFILLSLYILIHSVYNYLVFNFFLIHDKIYLVIVTNIIILLIFLFEILIHIIFEYELKFPLLIIIPVLSGLIILSSIMFYLKKNTN